MARLTGSYSGFPGDSTRRTTTQELPLGAVAYGPGGQEYVYVKAGATVAQYRPNHVTFIRHFVGSLDERWKPYLFLN